MFDLGKPFSFHIVEGRRTCNRKADEEDISLGIWQWAKSVVIFLSSGIPKTKTDGFPVDQDACRVVIESWEQVNDLSISNGRTCGKLLTLWECIPREMRSWCMISTYMSGWMWVTARSVALYLGSAQPFQQLHHQ